nr:hydrogenase maturation protease [FCB group bacterium]
AGFNLLDLLAGREKALIVDTMVSGRLAPGTLSFFKAGVLTPGKNLITSHQISLPTILELGKILGVKMPQVVDVIAVEAEDVETLSEELTPTVQKAVDGALDLIYEWISQNSIEKERV